MREARPDTGGAALDPGGAPRLSGGCASTSTGAPGDEHGAIALKKLPHGEYMQYLPRGAPKGILVIAHGSTEEEKSGEDDIRKLAETFLRRWVEFADEQGLIAVAPLFDHSFGSWISEPGIALGGYRGLAGKEIGADEFVDRIVEQYRPRLGGAERFYLQFAGRYAVRHPDHLKALVLSAPGRYAFPDPQAPWPVRAEGGHGARRPTGCAARHPARSRRLASGRRAADHGGGGSLRPGAAAPPGRARRPDPGRLCPASGWTP